MKVASYLVVLAFVVCDLAMPLCAFAQEELLKNDFRVSGSVLYQGKQAFVINAIETPSLMQASEDTSAFATALARVFLALLQLVHQSNAANLHRVSPPGVMS